MLFYFTPHVLFEQSEKKPCLNFLQLFTVVTEATTSDPVLNEPVVVLTTPPPPPHRLTIVTDEAALKQVKCMDNTVVFMIFNIRLMT